MSIRLMFLYVRWLPSLPASSANKVLAPFFALGVPVESVILVKMMDIADIVWNNVILETRMDVIKSEQTTVISVNITHVIITAPPHVIPIPNWVLMSLIKYP